MNTFFLGHRVTISVKVLCFPPEEPPPSRLCSAQRRPQDRILWAPRPLSQGFPASTQPSAHCRLTPSYPDPESSVVPAPPCLGLTGESRTLCGVCMMGRGSGVRVGSWVPPLPARCSRAPHGIQVLETCVKNCGHRFHVLVASQDFVEGVLVRTHHRARQGAHPHPGACRQPGAGGEEGAPISAAFCLSTSVSLVGSILLICGRDF